MDLILVILFFLFIFLPMYMYNLFHEKEVNKVNIGNIKVCSNCGSDMKYYDKVSRIVRSKNRKTKWIKVERFRCPYCGCIYRNLPDNIFPYKQYEAEIIRGVLEGFITSETIGYEDYPCEMTMFRWKAHKSQLLL